MLGAALAFSLMSLSVKLAGQRLPSQELVLIRSLLTLGFTVVALRASRVPVWGQQRGWLLMRGLVGFVALSCVFYALTRLPLADATVIQYTNPVFTAVLAALFLGEGMGRGEVAGTVVSLAGVALIARPTFLFGAAPGALDLLAVGVALAGAVLSGVAYVIIRKLRTTEHPLVIVFYFPLVSSVGALPTALPTAVLPTAAEWVVLVVGVAGMAQIGQVLLTKGLALERAGRAMSMSYLQIVFAAIWGVLFLGEVPEALDVAGALLVIGGATLTSRAAPTPGGRRAAGAPAPAARHADR